MFNLGKFQILQREANGDVWRTLDYTRPFGGRDALDLTLDSASIEVADLPDEKAFEPFTLCRFVAWQNESYNWGIPSISRDQALVRYYVTANCTAELSGFGRNIYTHKMELVELSKLLEGEVCDNLTYRNKLKTKQVSQAVPVYPVITGYPIDGISEKKAYYTPIVRGGNFRFYQHEELFSKPVLVGETEDQLYFDGIRQLGVDLKDPVFIPETVNTVEIIYGFRVVIGSSEFLRYYSYTIQTTDALEYPAKYYTVYDALERLLTVYDTPIYGRSPKWKIDPTLDFLKDIDAPEFTLTNGTLFDNLVIIAGFVHAIPRLVIDPDTMPTEIVFNAPVTERANMITFDFLGGKDQWTSDAPFKKQTKGSFYDSNEYFYQVDGFLQNVSVSNGFGKRNFDDEQIGTNRYPYVAVGKLGGIQYGTKAVTSSSPTIETDSAVFILPTPAQIITRIIGRFGDNTVNLTGYLFESEAYELLSDFGAQMSKQYAIRWTKGSDMIDGFTFSQDEIFSLQKQYAIQSIFAAEGVTVEESQIPLISFYVEYIPIVNARYKQRRPIARYNAQTRMLQESPMTKIYNQSGNILDAISLGQNMRGVAARLGNEIRTSTFYCDLFKIPKCGDLFEGDYVGAVDWNIDVNTVRVTVTTTPNFNMLSQFLALNSNYRIYDVAKDTAQERDMNFSTTVWIGTGGAGSANLPTPEEPSIYRDPETAVSDVEWIGWTFKHSLYDWKNRPFAAAVTTYGKSGDAIKQLTMPLTAFAVGNSIAFTVPFKDAYSAGVKSVKNPINDNRRIARNVPYGDVYGEIDSIQIDLIGGVKQGTDLPSALPFDLPDAVIEPRYYMTGARRVIKKDSGEILNITKQIHFRTIDPECVIGSQLTQSNALVRDLVAVPDPIAVLLTEPVNQFAQKIEGGAEVPMFVNIGSGRGGFSLLFRGDVPAGTWKGLAVIDPETRELYIGYNGDISSETGFPIIKFRYA